MNLLLVRLGYPPVIIRKRDRRRYLRDLERADAGDSGDLAELLARSLLETLNRFVVPAVAGPARLVPLSSLATTGVSVEALRRAAARGRLKVTRDQSGRWLSSRDWVEEYKRGRYSREPRRRRP